MNIDLAKLNFTFSQKPLLIGGMAMQYYGLRPSGADIDFVISAEDHGRLWQQYPEHRKELWGDLGVCIHEFEIWDSINLFDYPALSPGAVDEGEIRVISLDRLLFLKALGIRVPKYQKDLELLAERITRDNYANQYQRKMQTNPSPRHFVGKWELDPSLCVYQVGQPPRARTYTVEYDGHGLHFIIESTMEDGRQSKQEADAIPNGVDHPNDNPAIADTICYSVLDQFTLLSTAKKQGSVVAYARRVISQDGGMLTITQSGMHFDNVSVYHRL